VELVRLINFSTLLLEAKEDEENQNCGWEWEHSTAPCPPTTQALEIDMKAGSWYLKSSSAYCLLKGYNPLFVKPQRVALEKITMSQILPEDYKSVRLWVIMKEKQTFRGHKNNLHERKHGVT